MAFFTVKSGGAQWAPRRSRPCGIQRISAAALRAKRRFPSLPCAARPFLALPVPALRCPSLPRTSLSGFALPAPALRCSALTYPAYATLPYPALPYATLPCPNLPYPSLLYPLALALTSMHEQSA